MNYIFLYYIPKHDYQQKIQTCTLIHLSLLLCHLSTYKNNCFACVLCHNDESTCIKTRSMLRWMMCSWMYNFEIFRYVGCGPPFVHRHQTPYILLVGIALSLLESLHWQNHEMVNWSQFKDGKTHSLKWIKSGGKFRTESGTTGLLLLKGII